MADRWFGRSRSEYVVVRHAEMSVGPYDNRQLIALVALTLALPIPELRFGPARVRETVLLADHVRAIPTLHSQRRDGGGQRVRAVVNGVWYVSLYRVGRYHRYYLIDGVKRYIIVGEYHDTK